MWHSLIFPAHHLDEVANSRLVDVDFLESLREMNQGTDLLWKDIAKAGAPAKQIIQGFRFLRQNFAI